ncbi:transcriptional regulator [Chryseobacterium limigenitum]|uniref:Uncharacterized protein n=1 Tax=Chryseobacterium limigenitum TaxID=1612149 RepID=A0A1K2IXQ7_9FLAO|nr:hypothetical protein [Chryseobacterium limigenitum]SFZ97143.1 hypothetical protein SAMN05216324_1465 [Chryseobacterium limigenitum]
MKNEFIFGTTQNEKELKEKLSLLAPSDFLSANSIMDFERFKKVDIDWLDICEINKFDENINDIIPTTLKAVKTYFYRYWDLKKFGFIDWDEDNFDNLTLNVKDSSGNFQLKNIYWSALDISYLTYNDLAKDEFNLVDAKNILCLKHKNANERIYAFFDKKNKPLSIIDLLPVIDDTTTIETLWKKIFDKAVSIKLVILNKSILTEKPERERLSKTFSRKEILNREVYYFREEYKRLDTELEFINKVINAIDTKPDANNQTKLDELIKNYSDNLSDEQLSFVYLGYFNLKNKSFEIQNKIDDLCKRVEKLGFYICLADTQVLIIGNKTFNNAKKGNIYQSRTTHYEWTTVETRTRPKYNASSGLLGSALGSMAGGVVGGILGASLGNGLETYEVVIPHSGDFFDPIEIRYTDPLIDLEESLTAKNKNIKIFRLKKSNAGFITDEGLLLSEILKKCENDEDFRINCVVIIPKYDFILSDKKYPTGAFIFYNPLPSIIPSNFPVISIRERLSYRIAWKGAELGQMAASINLAPGETRQITLSSSFTQNTNNTYSSKTTSDVSLSNSFDLSTEFQNEASREMSKTDSFEAEVSGSYGGFVSGGASGSTTTNLKTFSREMSKIAKKTSSNLNKKFTSEINQTSSMSISVEEKNSRSSTISNINQGSTLNLFIYQINNRFSSGLFLDDLEFSIKSNREIISQSGIYEDFNVSFQKIEDLLDFLYKELCDILNKKIDEERKYIIFNKICNSINEVLSIDYLEKKYDSHETDLTKKTSNILSLSNKINDFIDDSNFLDILKRIELRKKNKYDKDSKTIKEEEIQDKVELENRIRKLKGILLSKEIQDTNLLKDEMFTINSGAFYIDSMIGLNPATEPYADKMRVLEQERVKSVIENQKAINKEIKTKTKLLEKDIPFVTKISNIIFEQNENHHKYCGYTLLHISTKINKKVGFLKLFDSINDNKWRLFLQNYLIQEVKVVTSKDGYFIKVFWENNLPEINILEKDLLLINKKLELKFISDE